MQSQISEMGGGGFFPSGKHQRSLKTGNLLNATIEAASASQKNKKNTPNAIPEESLINKSQTSLYLPLQLTHLQPQLRSSKKEKEKKPWQSLWAKISRWVYLAQIQFFFFFTVLCCRHSANASGTSMVVTLLRNSPKAHLCLDHSHHLWCPFHTIV